MARYAIGDIQGCYKPFMELLNKIAYNPSVDTLYLVGDLVNRGPESLKVLQWIYDHSDNVISVLGNHDFYLIGRYCKIMRANDDETINDILSSPNAKKLVDWLRTIPLIYNEQDYLIVHAGVYPKLPLATILEITKNISLNLQANDYVFFMEEVWGNKPSCWSKAKTDIKKMRFMLNACTRMRFLNKEDYSLNLKYKGDLADMPEDLIPWFKVTSDPSIDKKVIFGHWAALGFLHTRNFIALDTGCVWGRALTAIDLDSYEIAQVHM